MSIENHTALSSPRPRPTGMVAFTIVWFGQIISMLGTGMTNFALTLWAYEQTGRATPLAMLGFAYLTPIVVLAPFVGVIVDRGNRKWLMLLSDLAAAIVTAGVLVLYASGQLEVWHLYFTSTVLGIFQGFQWPTYSAAITLMLPKKHYARANGMLEVAGSGSAVIAPLLAGALIGPLTLSGILIIDLVTAVFAIATVAFIEVPQPVACTEESADGGLLRGATFGFRYIFARPSLVALQLVLLVGNFFRMLPFAVMAPMILGRTGNDELIFGSVQSAGAIGGVLGGVLMSTWGGPRRRIDGVLQGWFWMGLLGQAMFGVADGLVWWALASFLVAFFGPVVNGSNQAIWQAKIPPEIQGRVFAARRFIAWMVTPLSWLLAGPLCDQVLEPAMALGGSWVPIFGWLVGSGKGAGIALLFVVTGLLSALVGLVGYAVPIVRDVEESVPDHEQAEPVTAEPRAPAELVG